MPDRDKDILLRELQHRVKWKHAIVFSVKRGRALWKRWWTRRAPP